MPLLAKGCNGTDKSMELPEDEEFWTKFDENLSSWSNLQEKDRETSKTAVVPETSVG